MIYRKTLCINGTTALNILGIVRTICNSTQLFNPRYKFLDRCSEVVGSQIVQVVMGSVRGPVGIYGGRLL